MRHTQITFSLILLAAIQSVWGLSVTGQDTEQEGPPRSDLREWADASGTFKVKAELLTADDNLVVLELTDGDLVALKREQLSKADRQYVQKATLDRGAAAAPDVDSQWQLADGEVVAGRLMGFGRQELNVKRDRGDLWVNGHRLSELPAAYRKILPSVVSSVDQKQVGSLDKLERYLASNGGGPFKYTLSGVQLDLTEWGVITIPLSLLAPDEAKEVMPGFERWTAAQADDVSDRDRYDAESRERLALDSRDRQRRRYQAAGRQPWNQRQMQMMELSLLAADSGLTDIWQVELRPRHRYGYSRTIMVSAQSSLFAREKVAQRFPGWTIGAIAKRSY
ncbi:hypothetical protein K227x_04320 [Rubripirellula lacrimiformis]|uniref:SLA1 homology domain-containing protein n=1 Tax=Rubripirellula lacrimiformis TaxID=1930273 RepID=A0A517N4K9_9BACT|nr:SHD1 domain-containing protein [Rubripirellula lacrimiformis]QDT02061.1 hypothetical protein K227x_04320 [Rubripirellula lacrimiformis]